MVRAGKYTLLDPSVLIEEETVPGYQEKHYYPVKIGELFRDQYKVIGKLGYGSASTVWLCHDLHKDKEYVALKVYINSPKVQRELPIYKHINGLNSEHYGYSCVRRLVDSFQLNGPDGVHTCFVLEALGMNLEELRGLIPGEMFPPDLVRQSFCNIIHAMHFIHTEAHVVHTDIQPKNILFGILDDSTFIRFERAEHEKPMPRKELPSRTLFTSRPMPLSKGCPKLSDLSEARFDGPHNHDLVMPDVYRAPEVVLDMPWSYPIDTWGLAMTLWDLFEPKRLFSPHGDDGVYSEAHHLAQMVSLMGPPPLDFLERSERSRLFWDVEGNWKAQVPIPEKSLETAEQRLEGKDKSLFLVFIRRMLRWKPEDRDDLQSIIVDDWFADDPTELEAVTGKS